MAAFVGRTEPLDRLLAAYRALTAEPNAIARGARLVLVTGEAGIGKTSLLRRFAVDATAAGGVVAWGSAWDGQAPAWWPWTQALRALVGRGGAPRDTPAELAAILPELGPAGGTPDGDAGRVRVFDAVDRLLARSARRTPVVVVLDDLHWADPSTVDLARFLIRMGGAPVLLVGAYRPHELDPAVAVGVAELAAVAEPIALRALAAGEVAELVTAIGGSATRPDWIPIVVERSGGHPFLAREVCHLLAAGRGATEIPTAVREVVRQRVARLPAGCAELLEAAAVASTELRPSVLADVTGMAPARVTELVEAATAAGLVADGRFVHDLYRETIASTLGPTRRLELHARVATALLDRHARGGAVLPAELAGHLAAAVPRLGSEPALWWARVAAEADTRRFAFAEAAGHLARVREAVADTGAGWPEADLVDLLTAEADLRLRSGDANAARRLLDTAWIRAVATGQADLLGSVALGQDRLGARFAMPRAELAAVLDAAATALDGAGTADEALVLAALARQWQHSVPAERRRARPLAERSVAIARSIDDPATLARCLLAEHDTRWTPGTASARAAIAAEIAGLAQRAGDPERHAQALLLLATAQLENGSPAFRVTLGEHQYLTEQLHEPRHDYVRLTRQAALALLDGDVEAGDALSAEAAVLGETVGDSDTGNVRMSQRLEIVRARGDAEELLATAADAVRWWVGAPAHAHAVAAGFRARAGDLAGARRELDTVLALDWRTDRSYLWSVFVGELTAAAVALDDRPLCQQLLDDLLPVADTGAVNGALVCYMGSHGHRVGQLYAALGDADRARHWFDRALAVHRRLGAHAWEAETAAALPRSPRSPTGGASSCAASATCGLPRTAANRRTCGTARGCTTSPRCSRDHVSTSPRSSWPAELLRSSRAIPSSTVGRSRRTVGA